MNAIKNFYTNHIMQYDGTNFPSYKRTMNDIMVMCKLTKYFNGEVEAPTDIDSTEYEDWLSNMTTVVHIMRLNCDAERKSMVEECTTAKEILDILQENYLSISTYLRGSIPRLHWSRLGRDWSCEI